jgi:hypothetical protein
MDYAGLCMIVHGLLLMTPVKVLIYIRLNLHLGVSEHHYLENTQEDYSCHFGFVRPVLFPSWLTLTKIWRMP